MKKLVYVFVGSVGLWCLGVSCAMANLGDTYKQSCAKFGKPHHRSGDFVWWYINNDFNIGATFNDQGVYFESH